MRNKSSLRPETADLRSSRIYGGPRSVINATIEADVRGRARLARIRDGGDVSYRSNTEATLGVRCHGDTSRVASASGNRRVSGIYLRLGSGFGTPSSRSTYAMIIPPESVVARDRDVTEREWPGWAPNPRSPHVPGPRLGGATGRTRTLPRRHRTESPNPMSAALCPAKPPGLTLPYRDETL